jgi:hypothetical protein
MTVEATLSPPPRREVTRVLAATLTTVTTRTFSVADVPTPAPGQLTQTPPYGIVYPINDGQYLGGLGAPENCAEFAFQVTSVGATSDQCEWLSDRVRGVILGRNADGAYDTDIPLTSPFICNYRHSLSGAGNMIRNDLMWSTTESFMLYVCPQ